MQISFKQEFLTHLAALVQQRLVADAQVSGILHVEAVVHTSSWSSSDSRCTLELQK